MCIPNIIVIIELLFGKFKKLTYIKYDKICNGKLSKENIKINNILNGGYLKLS